MSLIIEFVAGPRCGETEIVDPPSAAMPPLSMAFGVTAGSDAPEPVYVRRDRRPDPWTGRWLFDHTPL